MLLLRWIVYSVVLTFTAYPAGAEGRPAGALAQSCPAPPSPRVTHVSRVGMGGAPGGDRVVHSDASPPPRRRLQDGVYRGAWAVTPSPAEVFWLIEGFPATMTWQSKVLAVTATFKHAVLRFQTVHLT